MAIPKPEFYKNDDSATFIEIGFGTIKAGENSNRPSDPLMYPFHLWNDKGGVEGSTTMIEVKVAVLRKYIEGEVLGTSDGSPDQTFNIAIPPIVPDSQTIYVDTVIWEEVDDLSLVGVGNYYECNDTTGVITFGDGVNGSIPANGAEITADSTPDKPAYGKQWAPDRWAKIKSLGVIGTGIVDDLEGAFTPIGNGVDHSIGEIPSDCARKLYLEVDVPKAAIPAGGEMKVVLEVSYQHE